MGIEVRRLAYGLGAEVRGVDPTRLLDAATVQAVRAAWLEHQVLVFPDMRMSMAQHVAFTRYFGELEVHPMLSARGAFPEYPEILELRSQPLPGRIQSDRNAVQWHSDGAFTLRPPTGSLLHCQAIPDVGGDTCFTNMYMAYERLSDTLKGVIDGLSVVNNLANTQNFRQRAILHPEATARDLEKLPPVVQPMVRVHPETGRKALYVNEAMSVQIFGMTPEESAGLLKYLFEHSVHPTLVYRHRWRVNDLVMWDNRCSMHMVPGDYDRDTQFRHMLRTTLMGEPSGELYRPAVQRDASVRAVAAA